MPADRRGSGRSPEKEGRVYECIAAERRSRSKRAKRSDNSITWAPPMVAESFEHLSIPKTPRPRQPIEHRAPSIPTLFPPILTDSDDPQPARRRTKNKKKPDGHIPRPLNAFMLFRLAFIKNRHLDTSIVNDHTQLSKIIGYTWQNLPPKEREYWEAQGILAMKKHEMMYPGYTFQPAPPVRRHKRKEHGLDAGNKRCARIAALLLEGKRGDEVAAAVRIFDQESPIQARFREPLTAYDQAVSTKQQNCSTRASTSTVHDAIEDSERPDTNLPWEEASAPQVSTDLAVQTAVVSETVDLMLSSTAPSATSSSTAPSPSASSCTLSSRSFSSPLLLDNPASPERQQFLATAHPVDGCVHHPMLEMETYQSFDLVARNFDQEKGFTYDTYDQPPGRISYSLSTNVNHAVYNPRGDEFASSFEGIEELVPGIGSSVFPNTSLYQPWNATLDSWPSYFSPRTDDSVDRSLYTLLYSGKSDGYPCTTTPPFTPMDLFDSQFNISAEPADVTGMSSTVGATSSDAFDIASGPVPQESGTLGGYAFSEFQYRGDYGGHFL